MSETASPGGLRRIGHAPGFIVLFLLTASLCARADETLQTDVHNDPLLLERLVSSSGRAGLAVAQGIATADYRAYGLDDFLPLEQIYLPTVALPHEQHPSLLFSTDQRDLIRTRIAREPYDRWWHVVIRRAQANLTLNTADSQLQESKRADVAKSCAFAWAITGDDAYLKQAREALLHISPPPQVTTPEGGQPGQGWGDWIRASFLMQAYCLAYDLVASDLSLGDQQVIAGKIAAEAEQLSDHLILAPPNNHKTIMAVAVGTAALTIPSYGCGQPQNWLDAAMTNLRSGLAQIDRDGSYREGPFYAGYISQLLFPFFFFLKQTTGVDLFAHRRVEDLTAWYLRIVQPNGTIPLFDDAWQEQHPFLPLLVGNSRLGGVARWRYEHLPQTASGRLSEVEFICAFDDRVPAQDPPWERTSFFPDGGMAVFGDGWSSEGIYLLLMGEGGEALASGHEHIDPGHLVLHAYGRELIIDPGAGPQGRLSKGRSWYLSGEGHNMLLVDGKGPTLNPFSSDQRGGELHHCFSSSVLSGASVRTRYRGAEIQRTVFFLGQRYFLIFDRLESPQPHQYDLVLHGLGQLQQEDMGRITWSSDDASVDVQMLSPQRDAPTISLHTGQRSPQFLNTQPYTYLRAGLSRRQTAHFTTLLLPQRTHRPGLESTELTTCSGEQARAWELRGEDLGESRHVLMTTEGHSATVGGTTTDALVSVTGLKADGKLDFLVAGQATFYAYLGDTCFTSDRPVTVSLISCPNCWCGYVDAGDEEVTLWLETGFDPGQVRFGQYPHPYRYGSGKVELHLAGSGPLELGSGPPMIHTPEAARESYPFLETVARQEQPMARLEELTPEHRFLAQQQALEVTRVELSQPLRDLSQQIGLGPAGLGQALGVITGLADKAYDPEGWARLNLPQHLEGRTGLSWGQLFYRQEGTITKHGLRVERLEGRLSLSGRGVLTAGYQAPFPGVEYHALGYQGEAVSLAASREQTQYRWQYQLSVLHHPGDLFWGLQGHLSEDSNDYGLDLLLGNPSLRAELSQHREPTGRPRRRLFLARHGHRFSPRLELQDEGRPGPHDVRAGWSSQPAEGWSWEMDSWIRQDPNRLDVRELNSLVSAVARVLAGSWSSTFRNEDGFLGYAQLRAESGDARWNLRWRYGQRHRPFIMEEQLTLLRDWAGWMSTTSGLLYRPGSMQKNDLLLSLAANLRPGSLTQLHIKLEGSSRRKEWVSWAVGLDRWGRISWGGEWSRTHIADGRGERHLSVHGSLSDSRGRGLRGRAELELCQCNRVAGYQVEIEQMGEACSPGLLFSKKPIVGVRNDGFIRIRF